MTFEEKILAAKMTGSNRLNLSCGLKAFPREIYQLADTLEILDLSGNELTSLPDDLDRLHKLRILFCSDNQFTRLPDVLGKLPRLSMVGFKANKIHTIPAAALNKSLRWLILTDNQISQLPAEIGLCKDMQKLMLAGNRLQTLPPEMSACTKLELLRIAANRFNELPAWLLNLPRLSWLAYAGNPCTEIHEQHALTQTPLKPIEWEQLTVANKLGEGASGIIHQAAWHQTDGIKSNVALKLFKGEVTSDGLPSCEKAACLHAGEHPNLITVHGKLNSHPQQNKGLIMSLVDPGFRNLAGPPSLDSCTRDIYAADTRFTLSNALRIAHNIASAAQHLHRKGIMHGDLYAHNILHDDAGNCLLGDFGAASFYSLQDLTRAEALQRIEVRAFGCLLEELLERCDDANYTKIILNKIKNLQSLCKEKKSLERPDFQEILLTIENIQRQIKKSS